jgi:mRNA interferase MazF
MTSFKRGDVVLVDLGYVAKVRPCVVISIPNPDSRRNMSVVQKWGKPAPDYESP